jgi:hypothetical protein
LQLGADCGTGGFLGGHKTISAIIDRYNALLERFDRAHARFHHVDLRDLIDPDTNWVNELHLKNSAYTRVAERLDERLREAHLTSYLGPFSIAPTMICVNA